MSRPRTPHRDRPAAAHLASVVLLLSGLLLAPAHAAPAPAPETPRACFGPNDPEYNPAECERLPQHTLYEQQWNFFSFLPRYAQRPVRWNDGAPEYASGSSIDLAWSITRGRPDVLIAVTDSGIAWDDPRAMRDLVKQAFLNRGELPPPQDPATCQPGPYDRNRDGKLSLLDYADDPFDLSAPHDCRLTDANGTGFYDPQDLIRVFSDGLDQDDNGYVDDIAGWDFYEDDNDPQDSTHFGHGTARTIDAVAETNNGHYVAGVCPRCQFVSLRTGDTFIGNGDQWGQAIVYAADLGATAVSAAWGSAGAITPFQEAAVRYAVARGTVIVAAVADENSYHHNYPSTLDRVLASGAIVPNAIGFPLLPGPDYVTDTYLNHSNCVNYGGRMQLMTPAADCASESTGKLAGIVGLLQSRARDLVDQRALDRPLSVDEIKQLLIQTADDVNKLPDPREYPSRDGWDQTFGYGRTHALRALEAIGPNTIPPEAWLVGPRWFAVLDPTRTARVPIVASVAATRPGAAPYRYWVEYARGVEPQEGEYQLLASGSGFTPLVDATLAVWDISGLDGSGVPRDHDQFTYTLRLRVLDALGNRAEDRRTVAVHSDPDLLPPFPLDLRASGESSPAFADLDGDGAAELVVATADGQVHAFRADGSELPGWPVQTDVGRRVHRRAPPFRSGALTPPRDAILASVAVGDLFRDGVPHVVAATADGAVYVWRPDGSRLAPFPVQLGLPPGGRASPHGANGVIASPALADLDGRGRELAIVVLHTSQYLYALRPNGSLRPGWPVLLRDAEDAVAVSSPAIGDIDGDGSLDVVAGTGEAEPKAGARPVPPGALAAVPPEHRAYVAERLAALGRIGRVYAVQADGNDHPGGPFLPGWPIRPSGLVLDAYPVIGEGVPHAPALAPNPRGGLLVGIHAASGTPALYDGGGRRAVALDDASGRGGLQADTAGSAASGAFFDPLGTGDLAYVVGTVTTSYAPGLIFRGQKFPWTHFIGGWVATGPSAGQRLPGWPRAIEDWQFLSQPSVANLDGQGDPVTGFPTPHVIAGSGGYLLHAYAPLRGGEAPRWPKFTGGWILAAPATGDFDGDGKTEVAVTTREGLLWVWRTAGAACDAPQWPKFRHDLWNSGNYLVDATPPGRPRDLRASRLDDGLSVAWTAPGGDGTCGAVAAYEVAWSDEPLTPATLSKAERRVVPASAPAGATETLTLERVPAGARYLGVRARDAAGNVGPPAVLRLP